MDHPPGDRGLMESAVSALGASLFSAALAAPSIKPCLAPGKHALRVALHWGIGCAFGLVKDTLHLRTQAQTLP